MGNFKLMAAYFPIFGIVFCYYGAYKLAVKFADSTTLLSVLTLLFGTLILYVCLYFIKKIEHKWEVKERWELIKFLLFLYNRFFICRSW